MTKKKIDEVLAEEGEAAETYQVSDDLPARVDVSRPNLGRPTVVSVRLPAEEHARLQGAAAEANLPVSTLIRIWALDRVRAERQGTDVTVDERLARLERAVFQQSA